MDAVHSRLPEPCGSAWMLCKERRHAGWMPRRIWFMERKAASTWIRQATLVFIACVAALFLSAAPLHAQVDTGSILGTITDASGAPISGASVTLTNEGTSAALTTTTGSDGAYKFTPVRIGSYSVKTSYQGFQTTTQK